MAFKPPTMIGAMVSTRKSTSRAFRKLSITLAPPSTIRVDIPNPARQPSNSPRSILPSSSNGIFNSRAPALTNALSRAGSAVSVVAIHGLPLIRVFSRWKRLALGGVRNRLSNTTACGLAPSTSLTVRRGSSAKTVPMPTRMASCAALSWWVRCMLSGPLRARGAPRLTARLPSRLWA